MKKYYLFFLIFMTGSSVMILEIVGTRVIGPFYGVSLYVWSSLITVALVALSLGYWIGGMAADRWPKRDVLYLIVALAGLSSLIIPFASISIMSTCHLLGLRAGALTSSTIMFLFPITFLGMIAPFAVKLYTEEMKRLGTSVGRLYAISTMGSVMGTLLVGFFLIPNVGTKKIFCLLAITLFCVSGIGWILEKKWIKSLLIVICIFYPGYQLNFTDQLAEKEGLKVIHQTESSYGQLKVVDTQRQRYLLLDGILQTGMDKVLISAPEQIYLFQMSLLGLLPYYYPSGRQALLIGLGGGRHFHLLNSYGIDVDSVEIDRNVVQTARKYFGFNGPVKVEDGRYVIQNTKKKYDFVILDTYSGEVIPTQLFSVEAFARIRDILTEKGILAVHYIGFPEESLVSWTLHRTLREVFSYIDVYPTEYGNQVQSMFFFASVKELRLSPRRELEPYGLDEITLEEYAASKIEYPLEKGIVVTDDYNPIDFWRMDIATAWREKSLSIFGKEIIIK